MKKKISLLISLFIISVFLSHSQPPPSPPFPPDPSPDGIPNTGLTLKSGTTFYLDDSTYKFPDTKITKSNDASFVLQNVSGSMMAIMSANVSGPGFSKVGTIPSYLDDSGTISFSIHFAPTTISKDTGYIRFTTDYSTDQYFQLNLIGNGIANTGIRSAKSKVNCSIYPNPVRDNATVKISNEIQFSGSFILYNISGQKVFNKNITGNSFMLQREQLPAGIYQYIIMDDQSGLINSGRVLFE